MTVYVDNANIPAAVQNGGITHVSRWAHLTADTKAELHAFAVGKLGLRRSYFQDKPNGHWHYDVTEGKRWQAIRLGAVEIGCDSDAFERVWHAPGREGVRAPEPTGAATTDASSGPVEVPAPVPEPAPALTTVIHVRDSVHGKDGGDNEVYIGRPSKWGNPFVMPRDGDRAQVIAAYRDYLHGNPGLMAQLGELRGKTLVCYCAPQPCHGDVLAALANPVKVDQAWRDGLTSHQIRDVIVNLASSEVQHWCVDHARPQKETAVRCSALHASRTAAGPMTRSRTAPRLSQRPAPVCSTAPMIARPPALCPVTGMSIRRNRARFTRTRRVIAHRLREGIDPESPDSPGWVQP